MTDSKYKMVIIIRIDLKMSIGKIAAQVGHAAVSATEKAKKTHSKWLNEWLKEGQCKITVKANSEEEIYELQKKARKLNIPYALISDKGLTELPAGTITCLGIGPAPSHKINKITGDLTLF